MHATQISKYCSVTCLLALSIFAARSVYGHWTTDQFIEQVKSACYSHGCEPSVLRKADGSIALELKSKSAREEGNLRDAVLSITGTNSASGMPRSHLIVSGGVQLSYVRAPEPPKAVRPAKGGKGPAS
jgi:hypothetical protein